MDVFKLKANFVFPNVALQEWSEQSESYQKGH